MHSGGDIELLGPQPVCRLRLIARVCVLERTAERHGLLCRPRPKAAPRRVYCAHMEIANYIATLRHEGNVLATTAARAGLDTPIPTCPEWRIRDLVRHVGGIHRWAAMYVREGHTVPVDSTDLGALAGGWPDDSALIAWFRAGHAALLHALEAAEPGLDCWTFLPAPSPLAFWARRQAHETTIHRADTQSPSGLITPVAPAVAIDGIDELLLGFVRRPGGRLQTEVPRSLHLHATDAAGEWMVLLGPEQVEVRHEHAKGDCAVRGRASDLYLLLWNRRTPDGLDVYGDATLLDLWRRAVRIRWS